MLSYKVGDPVLIYFVDNSVRIRKFILSGIYDAQLEDIDKSLLIAASHILQNVNDWDIDEVSGLEIKLKNGYDIAQTATIIENIIEDSPTNEAYFVTTVNELLTGCAY